MRQPLSNRRGPRPAEFGHERKLQAINRAWHWFARMLLGQRPAVVEHQGAGGVRFGKRAVYLGAAMTSERGRRLGFAVEHDVPIPYLPRIRDYYGTLGYGAPYEWARYAEVPFRPLNKPLSRSRVTIITLRRPISRTRAIRVRGRPTTRRPSSTPSTRATPRRTHDLRISHVTIDRKHTTAEDLATYFPLAELHRRAASGGIGLVASRFHGAPTNRSHRVTLEVDGPEIVARCMADEVDAAILVPNCPVCHQTVSLVARMLEVSGISTVVMGCA
jgi:D-proline reductase (dithiol) PrdB